VLETSLVPKAVKIAVVLGVSVYVAMQVRKPDRFAGRVLAVLMNHSRAKLTDWGLSHIPIDKGFIVLDVGCGGGRTIEKLALTAAPVMFPGSTTLRAVWRCPERETKTSFRLGGRTSSSRTWLSVGNCWLCTRNNLAVD
jgi:hypothetical protein